MKLPSCLVRVINKRRESKYKIETGGKNRTRNEMGEFLKRRSQVVMFGML